MHKAMRRHFILIPAQAPVLGTAVRVVPMLAYKIPRQEHSSMVVIEGREGANLASLSIERSRNWRVQGLSISPYNEPGYNPASNRVRNIVSISSSSQIEIINNRIFTHADIATWSADDWNRRSSSGISVGSGETLIEGNAVENINFGITVGSRASNVIVRANAVINFAGDGLRGLGDDGLFEFNVVANGFKVNGNHDDGFQAFTNNRNPRVISRVTLRNNQFYYNLNHPNPSLISSFQGIGCFDGFFNNWVVENNLLYIDHWHGITLLGANNARVMNNTVIDANPADGRLRPWIKIAPLKQSQGGQAGSGNIVRNNIAELTNEGPGIIEDHNLDPRDFDLNDLFISVSSGDFRLKQGSSAINAGSDIGAPSIDIRRVARTSPVDIGAFEFGGTVLETNPPLTSQNQRPAAKAVLAPLMLLLED